MPMLLLSPSLSVGIHIIIVEDPCLSDMVSFVREVRTHRETLVPRDWNSRPNYFTLHPAEVHDAAKRLAQQNLRTYECKVDFILEWVMSHATDSPESACP